MGTQIRKLSSFSHKRNRREWEDVNNHSLRAFVSTFETSDTILQKTDYKLVFVFYVDAYDSI